MQSKDFYPSRLSARAQMIDRKDPIVYGRWSRDAPLSREQVDDYDGNGFLVLENVFDADEVSLLKAESEKLRSGAEKLDAETIISEPDSGEVRSVFSIHQQSDAFARVVEDARLAEVARFLLADEVYIHQSRLNYKPGFRGKDFYWHSDFETWHVEDGMPRMRALSMSVLLTENTPANGPTMFIPGSHKKYVTCVGETPADHYKESLKRQEYGVPDDEHLATLSKNGIDMPSGRPGTVVIFDCNTMHGSNSNITPWPRSNAFFVFNSVSNKLEAPFGPAKPRPEFIAARKCVETITPRSGRLFRRAA